MRDIRSFLKDEYFYPCMYFNTIKQFLADSIPWNRHFAIVYEWLKTLDLGSPEKYIQGVTMLEGGIKVIVDEYTSKPFAQGTYENHHKYIDIQLVLQGSEWLYWTLPRPLAEAPVLEEYSEENDIEFFKPYELLHEFAFGTSLPLSSGNLVVLWPNDWHMPCITPTNIPTSETMNTTMIEELISIPGQSMKKIVFKIPIK